MKESILVTGGAGFIGSHVVDILKHQHPVTIVDNLSTGFREALPSSVKFVHGDIQDEPLMNTVLRENNIQTVIHLAAHTVISESLSNPLKYYQNNTVGTLNLLRACLKQGVKRFIYSSTAAVYGESQADELTEQTPTQPTNPYGHSKLMSEQMLRDAATSSDLDFVILRYFNVAGACPNGKIGQRSKNATHLIKVAVQAALGKRDYLPIFGDNYPTFDGTCIRDFIHVTDLASAHLAALQYLRNGGKSVTLNAGYGKGTSVKEIIEAIEKYYPLPTKTETPREGDLAIVIANNEKMKSLLQWKPEFDSIDAIVKTALDFEKHLTNTSSL